MSHGEQEVPARIRKLDESNLLETGGSKKGLDFAG